MIVLPVHALLALALSTRSPQANPPTELPIQAPAGWESREQDSTLLFTPKDLPAGQVYTVLIPGLTQKIGTVRKLLEVAKATIGQVGEFKPANDPAGAKTDSGWEFEVVIGTLAKSGKNLMAQAMGLRKGEKEGIILVLSDSVATMQKYSEAFNAMVRRMDASEPHPVAAAAAGAVDLVYTVPDGWTATSQGSTVLLSWSNEATKGQFDNLKKYQLILLPSQPLKDTLRKTFRDLWDTVLAQPFETSILPLPMLRRLKSGALCAFDLADGAKYKSGQNPGGPLGVALYLLARGSRVVPMVGLFVFRGKELDETLLKFMESARIPNSGDEPIVPFTASEVTGAWTESSVALANYVQNGRVVGDASIVTGSDLTLNADGVFKSRFVAFQRGKALVTEDEGKWTIDDCTLTLQGKATHWYVVHGVGKDSKAGSLLVLADYYDNDIQLRLGDPRGYFQSTTFKKKE